MPLCYDADVFAARFAMIERATLLPLFLRRYDAVSPATSRAITRHLPLLIMPVAAIYAPCLI